MERLTRREYALEGLCCSSCATKIERESAKIEGVEEAVVDFVTKRLVLFSQKNDFEEISSQAQRIVKKIEPEVILQEISQSRPQTHDFGFNKVKMIQFAMSVVLYVIALTPLVSGSIELILFLMAYGLAGFSVLKSAFMNSLRGQFFDENFLMSIATFGAFAIGEYPEAVGVMLFYQIGEMLQELAVNRSRKSISELMDIRPDFAHLKVGDNVKRVSPEMVKVADLILVKPGEKVPLDGIIVEGATHFDTTALTGESMPRYGAEGDAVFGGYINGEGLITVEVSKIYGESTVAKILELVQNAGIKKAPTESHITRFARYYTPFVVFSAVALALIPPYVLQIGSFSEWFYKALVFLVVSCPCALVLSVPLGYFGGIGGASRSGILIKGGNYLEALSQVDTIVFDKTGTLTEGVFKVTEIVSQGRLTDEALLATAALLESHSNHPIARSILKAYGKTTQIEDLVDYEERAGLGIRATVDQKRLVIGNFNFMALEGVSVTPPQDDSTFLFIAIDGVYEGHITLSDQVKPHAAKALQELKALGVKNLIMLTGDRQAVAMRVADSVGIDRVYAELMPQDKVAQFEALEAMKQTKGKTIFVGDGINDAPVLARAQIGMAMGGVGSDAAIEAADVVLMTDELLKIPQAIKIARKTNQIVWQNIIFALGVKLIIMILGALGYATMWEAVFGDVGVALIAVMNSTRALKKTVV